MGAVPATVLIANRGEIACRILRTAKAMGYRTAAVYSDADRDALHVQEADVAVRIGPPAARASYLNGAAILTAAQQVRAHAVHPGYGFLAEDAAFARACAVAGLLFVGPPPEAIAMMGNKAAAKRRMREAGVPCVPGYDGGDQSDAALLRAGNALGFPLLVKAAAGGGGRGMRRVAAPADLPAALAAARGEAQSAFGSGELLLEQLIDPTRHVEVQLLADRHGGALHLGERECSVQRRYQKLLEEAPSPAVCPALRARMGEAAVAAAKAVGYTGAGTVEFLLSSDGGFYFLEMNTRLQVEHPVTELITGLDLVEWQFRLARGERLPFGQGDVGADGHAIEARLYAEAPHRGFLPQAGVLAAWRPPAGQGIRVDHGLKEGASIGTHYDALLAKIVAHGPSRETARLRLVRALQETTALGLATNRAFLIACLTHEEFARGGATTDFVARYFAEPAAPSSHGRALALAAALWFEESARRNGHDPARAFYSSAAIAFPLMLDDGTARARCRVTPVGAGAGARQYRIAAASGEFLLTLCSGNSSGAVGYSIDGVEREAAYAFQRDELYLKVDADDLCVRERFYDPPAVALADGLAAREVRAPLAGKLSALLVRPGDRVVRGQRLAVVEAMKMQHEVAARAQGKVAHVPVRAGDQVATNQLLVELEPEPEAAPRHCAPAQPAIK
jgi:geranyl-CoA carboxylase alpha subunit